MRSSRLWSGSNCRRPSLCHPTSLARFVRVFAYLADPKLFAPDVDKLRVLRKYSKWTPRQFDLPGHKVLPRWPGRGVFVGEAIFAPVGRSSTGRHSRQDRLFELD